MKTCGKCGIDKPIALFKIDNRLSSGRTGTCKECWNAGHRQWRHDNPEAQRRRSRNDSIRQAGLHSDEYDRILALQGGRCAICRTTEPGGSGRFHIDHDHGCCPGSCRPCGGCFRGLLCHNCNIVLGLVKDNPLTLREAASYLEGARKEVVV